MPPKRPSTAEAYESDNGFVEDAPARKKSKPLTQSHSARTNATANGHGGSVVGGGGQVGRDGDVFWELSGKRRVGVSEFKGRRMVNVREYYEKEGEMLPGKKGISLPIEQFNAIIKLLPHIEATLTEKGEKVERPDYSGGGEEGGKEEEEEEQIDVKKNFEQTSDEE